MVNYEPRRLDRTFAALGDPTRRAIVARLAEGAASVGELARPFDMTLAGVMKHVRVLERAGLLTHRKTGRIRTCRLEAATMTQARDWLDRQSAFWERQLDALAKHLEARAAPPTEHETKDSEKGQKP